MLKLGLVGKNISHSKSQQMYQELLGEEVDYTLFDFQSESEIPELEILFKQVDGLSITSPYKKFFIKSVETIGAVSELGIINCIRRVNNGFEATNTDYLVVDNFMKKSDLLKDRQLVILGNGAMADITKHSAVKNKIDYIQLGRSITKDFEDLSLKDLQKEIGKKLFVINACSWEYEYKGELSGDLIFWDYNYGHKFHFNRFTQSNTQYIDGIDLLKSQASFALKFWDLFI